MSSKKFSLGGFLTGLAAGAAALYLSDKKNRQKAKKVLDEGVETLKEIQEDPEKATELAKTKVKKIKKVAVKKTKKLTAKVKSKTKTKKRATGKSKKK